MALSMVSYGISHPTSRNLLHHRFDAHYENLPMQHTAIFSVEKFENFISKFLIVSLFLLKT